jgi:hypothetical protein
MVKRNITDAIAQRRWLDLLERCGVDVADVLDCRTDVRAEYIAMRAARLATATLPAPMALGLACAPIASCDARSIDRAIYDEGVALSTSAPARRRVLIGTAQTCLRSALARPHEWPVEVIAARLRTLAHLGGGLARDAIAKALVTLPPHQTLSLAAIEASCMIDPTATARVVLERSNELSAAGVDIERALRAIEIHGGLPSGCAAAYGLARIAVARALGESETSSWLAELLRLLRTRVDTLMRVLDGLRTYTVIPTTPSRLIAELDHIPDTLVDVDHVTVAAKLIDNASALESLLIARPADVDPAMRVWTTKEWRDHLRRAIGHTEVCAEQIERFACKVDRRHWYTALRAADLPQLGVPAVSHAIVDGDAYVLRLLDKRLDILTYLRFADIPARSCFRSSSTYYDDEDFRTREALIEVWKDPLSFCFRIERGRPVGFFFGSFAAVRGEPAVIMNSLYVRPNKPAVRFALVDAFERALCEPLRIAHVGIASFYNGEGKLPARYAERAAEFIRYRALAKQGWPVSSTYDDIWEPLNEPATDYSLYWREAVDSV